MSIATDETILKVEGLKTTFQTMDGVVKAVDDVSLEIKKKEVFGLVGESGCGKSTLALSILRLLPRSGRIVDGKILLHDQDLMLKSEAEMREIRGGQIAMIFQDPTSSLNPVFSIGDQIAEAIKLHRFTDKEMVEKEILNALKSVFIPDASHMVKSYPHEYSGGMRQRVMIATALSCGSEMLIADEPTTNLDVTIQAQILDLMREIKESFGTSILLITHNLGIIAEMADRIAVMYAGKIVEQADTIKIFKQARHPYTKALLNSIPRIDQKREELEIIPGTVPELINPPSGCRFHPRCKDKTEICINEEPKPVEIDEGHLIWCHQT
jgi:oligopeptide/dipeptide ABC transporter ATP-binding protein